MLQKHEENLLPLFCSFFLALRKHERSEEQKKVLHISKTLFLLLLEIFDFKLNKLCFSSKKNF
jgi:hypothetical protein